MKRTLLLASTLLIIVATAPDGWAQLEVHPNGDVTMGSNASVEGNLSVDGRAAIGSSVISNANFRVGDVTQGVCDGREARLATWGLHQGVGSIGVYGTAKACTAGSIFAFGLYGNVTAAEDNFGFGVYGKAPSNNYAGFFEGDVHVTGTLTSPSDARLKEGAALLASNEGVLSRLMRLRPQRFTYTKNPEFAPIGLADGEHFGVIAQEVEEVFPELVREEVHPGATDEAGMHTGEPIRYKSVNYIEMVPLLLQAIQEQQAEIDELKAALGRR